MRGLGWTGLDAAVAHQIRQTASRMYGLQKSSRCKGANRPGLPVLTSVRAMYMEPAVHVQPRTHAAKGPRCLCPSLFPLFPLDSAVRARGRSRMRLRRGEQDPGSVTQFGMRSASTAPLGPLKFLRPNEAPGAVDD